MNTDKIIMLVVAVGIVGAAGFYFYTMKKGRQYADVIGQQETAGCKSKED